MEFVLVLAGVVGVWWASTAVTDALVQVWLVARREWRIRRFERELERREDYQRRIGRWLP